jgi:hypothetical protein
LQLENLIEAKLDQRLLAHLIQRNVATGATYDYQIGDLIWAYERFQKFVKLRDWYADARVDLIKITLKAKGMLLAELIAKGRASTDIDAKRMYLIDAIRLEKEIEGLINGT